MKRFVLLFLMLCMMGCQTEVVQKPVTPAPIVPTQASVKIADLRDQTVALVMNRGDGRFAMYCSGIWVREKWILTAYHCVEGAVEDMGLCDEDDEDCVVDDKMMMGRTLNYRTYADYVRDYEMPVTSRARSATVMRLEGPTDLALLMVEGTPPPHQVAKLRSQQMNDGDEVMVVGHSAGMHYSLSKGIISASRRDGDLTLLQLTVTAAGGNSGGPVFDMYGQVIGVVSFGLRRAVGVTFATHRDSINDFLALDTITSTSLKN